MGQPGIRPAARRGAAKRTGTLKDRTRLAAFAHIAALAIVLFGVPLLLPTNLFWALAALPVVALSNSYWAMLHEAFHTGLGRSPAENQRLGRVLAILFGSAFVLLRATHLGHHNFNRHSLDRPDVFDAGRIRPSIAVARYYGRMVVGHYFGVIAGPLACLLPRLLLRRLLRHAFLPMEPAVAAYAERAILDPGRLRQIRIDGLAAVGLLRAAFWLYGGDWPFLAAFLIARGFLVGFVDNLHHYDTPLDDRTFAWNLELPHWASLLILHGNFHRQHHHHPGLPWHALPAARITQGDRFDAPFLTMALRQLRGPIPAARLPRGGTCPPGNPQGFGFPERDGINAAAP